MATAKKLPSGSYRVRVYDYTDENGKKHYKSFTAPTKKEAERMALTSSSTSQVDMPFSLALAEYIKDKENILSPSTIRGYKSMQKSFVRIANTKLSKLDQHVMSVWINTLARDHSPKSVSNAYSLVKSVLKHFGYDYSYNITLPSRKPIEYYIPTDEEVKQLLSWAQKNDTETYYAIMLSAFGTLRRSEICALLGEDIIDGVCHVSKAKVKGVNNTYYVKDTKTKSSDRYVPLPSFVTDVLPLSGPIVNCTPDALTRRFERIFEIIGTHPFRFHDLRHYSASIMHAIGIPDQYIQERGGWQSDRVLKQVYRNTLSDYSQKYAAMTNDYFNNMTQNMT